MSVKFRKSPTQQSTFIHGDLISYLQPQNLQNDFVLGNYTFKI